MGPVVQMLKIPSHFGFGAKGIPFRDNLLLGTFPLQLIPATF